MMRLYLDLETISKAETSAGTATELEDQSTAEHNSSYARRYEGVASGEAYDYDDPDVGGTWQREGAATVLDDVDSDRAARKPKKDKDKDEDTKKSTSEATTILKSLDSTLQQLRPQVSSIEEKFLLENGYSRDDISKGLVSMKRPAMRDLFSKWLCGRLVRSTDDILPRR